ncbi:MAG TPA: hypothetical protein VGM81_23180 [Burkholderiaceae bacterium]
MFPCKPEFQARPEAHMGLARCEAASQEFSLSWATLPDPTLATAALKQMREALAGKLGGPAEAPQAFNVPGMTPNEQALSQRLSGKRPAHLAVFSKGPVVYQAAMSGEKANDTAWEGFAGSIRWPDAAQR